MLAPVLALSGCVLLEMRKSDREQESHGVVALQIPGRRDDSLSVYALALKAAQPQAVVASQKVPSDRIVAFLLPAGGAVNIAVFSDVNNNRRFDAGEPSGWAGNVVPKVLSDAAARGAPLTVRLSTGTTEVPLNLEVPAAAESPSGGALEVNLGEVVSLNDPRFSAANGTLGFWQPYEFLTKLGWGVYFLQPYSPGKIPIVFVYGIDGSPQDWRSMIAALDRSKYQPWFFHYPSGLRLEKSANGLSRVLQILRARYGFSRLYVVAHSMGGLVSRGAVQQAVAESGSNFIPKFITLCTPWGGDAEADSGVKHMRYPVPAWIDMEPGSRYLKQIFDRKLPAGTDHYLIFDFQTRNAPWLKPDNDGVVQVASELFPPAQAGAKAMFGFNYGHVETLGKSDVQAKVNEYLDRPSR